MSRHFQREIYNGDRVGLPELTLFGWTATQEAADLGLKPHLHKDAFEICLIVGGSVQWWVEHEIYQLDRGAVYITQPDELHGGVDEVMHPCALYWLTLPHPGKQALAGLTPAQTRQLMGRLEKLQYRTFEASDRLEQYFKQLHAELRDQLIMGPVAARAALHSLLVQLLRDYDAAMNGFDNSRRSDVIRQAMQWIAKHMTEQTSVEAMAQVAGLGVSRFHERFLAEVGMTPADYRTRLRIRRAEHLLQHTQQTITRISFDLGFSTSQYFATVFKKYTSMSPGSYRLIKQSVGDD